MQWKGSVETRPKRTIHAAGVTIKVKLVFVIVILSSQSTIIVAAWPVGGKGVRTRRQELTHNEKPMDSVHKIFKLTSCKATIIIKEGLNELRGLLKELT